MVDYPIDAKSYSRRASYCLASDESRFLFYAAFELRCAVEVRHQEYADAQKKYLTSIPRSWKIENQGKALEKVFKIKKIQSITYKFEDEFSYEVRYIPVSARLRKSAQKLGDLLHGRSRVLWEPEEIEIRENLKRIAASVEYCLSGQLLCPAILDHKDPSNSFSPQAVIDGRLAKELLKRILPGTRTTLNVEYLDFPDFY